MNTLIFWWIASFLLPASSLIAYLIKPEKQHSNLFYAFLVVPVGLFGAIGLTGIFYEHFIAINTIPENVWIWGGMLFLNYLVFSVPTFMIIAIRNRNKKK